MPRPRHANGRPGTAVIPVDWQQTHRPTVAATMPATAVIRPPGTTQRWDEPTEQNVTAPHDPSYDGPARVQALGAASAERVTADDPEAVADYLVTITADGVAAVGDLVALADTGDPLLDDAQLRVERVVHGTHRFERDLFCRLTT